MKDLNTISFKRVPSCFEPMPGVVVEYDAVFLIPSPIDQAPMLVICSAGHGWDHVSVSRKGKRLPNWTEMDYVKRQLFKDDEVVMQLHVPVKDHINFEEVLHLWRPQNEAIPLPPKELV